MNSRSAARFAAIACWALLVAPWSAHALEVDPSSRSASLLFYRAAYQQSAIIPLGWTGDFSTSNPGTTSLAFRESVIDRVNYFRAMAGVPAEVALNDDLSALAQQAAFMMSANNQLSHHPPSTWTSYTSAGANAASNSNLALGTNGVGAIDAYMQEPGDSNAPVGHRRWLLYPPTDEMGTGDVPRLVPNNRANALWVVDSSPISPRPKTRDPFIAWPPSGYVPYNVTYPRWSFSLDGADFSSALVSMTENGAPVSAKIESPTNGYADNTVVWIPKGMSGNALWAHPAFDTVYDVSIDNVMVGGLPRSFEYQVTVFDPALLPTDFSTNALVDGGDLGVLRNHFGSAAASWTDGDANRDGVVDGTDFLQWQLEIGSSLMARSSIPEPTAIAMIYLAALGNLPRMRKCIKLPIRNNTRK